MNDTEGGGEEAPRSGAGRVGIAALNLLAPGLGLLRLGWPRQALLWWLLSAGPLALMILLWAASPILAFRPLVLCVAIAGVASLAGLVGSIWASWRGSGSKPAPSARRPVWSRWYVILVVAMFATLIVQLQVGLAHRFYKPFYIPSEAMMPTLLKDDRIVAAMGSAKMLRRGDVILFRKENGIYIKRLAALPGDRIAMIEGKVILNGNSLPQQAIGTERIVNAWKAKVTRLREHFPGENGDHFIYDSGPSPEDNYGEIRVPPGYLFVLGDNRDNSADSRIPREEGGVSLLPIPDFRGAALFYTWGPSHKSGDPVH